MTGDDFKNWRRGRGWTQAQAAEYLGMERRTVIRYEAGEIAIPRIVELATVANRLSEAEYELLDAYVKAVLTHHRDGTLDRVRATEALMHPLTAFADRGKGAQEFLPFMRLRLEKLGSDSP